MKNDHYVGDPGSRIAVNLLGVLSVCTALWMIASCTRKSETNSEDAPNIIVIFTDDQGYEDVGVYGGQGLHTPNLDRLAEEGMRFTSFYSISSVCTPSRAALMTGRYPTRVGLPSVIFPDAKIGLNPEELTLAEILQQQGYATAAIGKWHLGAHPDFLPTNHGFDQFFGLPYSSDMSPEPENNPREEVRGKFPPLPLIEDTTIIEREPDQTFLIRRYTENALEFIDKHQDSPFFLYMAHSLPHVPLYASDKFKGSSEQGLYGDVIHEIDWSVGQVMDDLEKKGIRENTLIIFTSDNGPWLVFGNHGGSAGPLREGKITTFEGGHRVPAIASWPGKIPEGAVSDAVVTTMDILPTVSKLTKASLPEDHILDGHDVWPILSGAKDAVSPNEVLYFYLDRKLQAVRSGPWKLHVPHEYIAVGQVGKDGNTGTYAQKHIELSLYNLLDDPGERHNVADDHPEVVEELMGLIDKARLELGDAQTGVRGSQEGNPGRIDQLWDKLMMDSK